MLSSWRFWADVTLLACANVAVPAVGSVRAVPSRCSCLRLLRNDSSDDSMMHQMRHGWRPSCPSIRAVAFTSSARSRCNTARRRQSRRCSKVGATSNCPATSITAPSTPGSGWCSAFLSTPGNAGRSIRPRRPPTHERPLGTANPIAAQRPANSAPCSHGQSPLRARILPACAPRPDSSPPPPRPSDLIRRIEICGFTGKLLCGPTYVV